MVMATTKLWFLLWICTHSYGDGAAAAAAAPPLLFVFGDSYADTGNHSPHSPPLDVPWLPPYGLTWPQAPAGRYSDGRVLTDFIAASLNISSPTPFRTLSPGEGLDSGINFAFGGSGVFHTFGPQFPPLGAQINLFQEILQRSALPQDSVAPCLALIVIAGNDYAAYIGKHPDLEGIVDFIPKVVEQMDVAVRKLYSLGFRKFALTNLEPMGCLPSATATTNYEACNETYNAYGSIHNELLSQHVSNLSRLQDAQFTILDLYGSFLSIIETTFRRGNANPLQPCCQPVGNSGCGKVDSNGNPLYVLCADPLKAFFWDSDHPTQAGWEAVAKSVLQYLSHGLPNQMHFSS